MLCTCHAGSLDVVNNLPLLPPLLDRQQYQYHHFQRRRPLLDIRNPRMQRLLVVVGGGSLVVWVVSQEQVPYTGRSHAILITQASERAMGAQTFAAVLEEAKQEGTLVSPNSPAARRVERVGRRIADTLEHGRGGGFQGHVKGLDWEFAVIRSPQVNAFVVPGGKVVVYTGTGA